MISRKWFAVLVAMALLCAGVMLARADGDSKKPGAGATDTVRHVKVDLPYSLLTDLTDDQKAKIIAIHTATLDAEKKLKEQERTDIMALLSDDQKQELAAAEAKKKADMKVKEKGTEDAPTTKPAN